MNDVDALGQIHPFALRISAPGTIEAFRSDQGHPFVLRLGQSSADIPAIRTCVNYSRLIESGRRNPELSSIVAPAREFLILTLKKTAPNPGWSLWDSADLDVQAYATSKILFGLGKEGVAELPKEDVRKAISFLSERTTEYCAAGSLKHPLLGLLGFQCLHELDHVPRELNLLIGHWADRILYVVEAELSRGRPAPLPPAYILFSLGVLLRALPDSIDDERIDKLLRLVSDTTTNLPSYSRGAVIRLADYAVGASVIDVLLYLLRSERTSHALLREKELLARTFGWLSTHSRRVRDDLHLFHTDLYQDSSDIDLWFNCAVVDLALDYKTAFSNLRRTRVLSEFGSLAEASSLAWSALRVGGFPWIERLHNRLIDVARSEIPGGGKLKQNGIILFGPAGTSKTTVAETIANELGMWPIVRIGPSQILREGLDRMFSVIDDMFRKLTQLHEAVLVFDDMDMLSSSIGKSSMAHPWNSGFIAEIMSPRFMALHKWGRNIYIFITNDLSMLNGSLGRAGRFDFVLPVGPPCKWERHALLTDVLGPTALNINSLSDIINDRATIGEILEWAYEVKASNLDIARAETLWVQEFSQSLQIDKHQHDEFLKAAQTHTSPISLR